MVEGGGSGVVISSSEYNVGDVKDLADIFGDRFVCGSGDGRMVAAAARFKDKS